MHRLKLNVESTTNIDENAWRISKELKGKKCLTLVDEIFDFIDLHEVMDIQDNLESKVVLASRLRDICKDMEADELINVKPLQIMKPSTCSRKKWGGLFTFLGLSQLLSWWLESVGDCRC